MRDIGHFIAAKRSRALGPFGRRVSPKHRRGSGQGRVREQSEMEAAHRQRGSRPSRAGRPQPQRRARVMFKFLELVAGRI